MKSIIDNYKVKIKEVEDNLRLDIISYFKNSELINKDRFKEISIKGIDDLSKIPSGSGFYVILTDMPVDNNECEFLLNNQRAIYRGHSVTVKERIKSHLFNDHYNSEYQRKFDSNKYLNKYSACLKFDENINGININQDRFSKYQWTVVIYPMKNSTQQLRQLTELAFDDLCRRPIKSKK